ncbi:hypothetical protein G6F43_009093 [Rhizopus delemar]|nr:hypothetical protein G6F43_009093 [Rhizopus delemar]
MSDFHQVVFEDGQGGLRNEEGLELMEIDELDVQFKKLVSMEDYLHKQLSAEAEMPKTENGPAMDTDPPKKRRKDIQKYNINERTGQRWWNQYKNDPDSFFVPKVRGDRKKLKEEHYVFLTDLVDENPSINVEQALEQLISKFDGLQIGKSAVHNFITKDMRFTFKRAAFRSLKRNNESNIEA